MTNDEKAFSLIQLGFNDYIAARHLINNKFILQGVTLASTSIEKYIKAILVSKGKTKKEIGVHFDKIDKLKKHLADCYTDFTNKIDDRFLDILGKAYQVRYYDDITNPVTIGFFINQFLCELDYTVAFFENVLYKEATDQNGNEILTFYKRAVNEKTSDLILNNYLFAGLTKKQAMEQEDTGYCIYINPLTPRGNIIVEGKAIRNSYDGVITLINVNFSEP